MTAPVILKRVFILMSMACYLVFCHLMVRPEPLPCPHFPHCNHTLRQLVDISACPHTRTPAVAERIGVSQVTSIGTVHGPRARLNPHTAQLVTSRSTLKGSLPQSACCPISSFR